MKDLLYCYWKGKDKTNTYTHFSLFPHSFYFRCRFQLAIDDKKKHLFIQLGGIKSKIFWQKDFHWNKD